MFLPKLTRLVSIPQINFPIRYLSGTVPKFRPILDASINNANKTIDVKFSSDSGSFSSFPWIYLEDNCICPTCYHASSQSRLRLLTQLDPSNSILELNLNTTDNSLSLTWANGHCSKFSEEWLLARKFKGQISSTRLPFRNTKQLNLWGKLDEKAFKLPNADYNNVMSNKDSQMEFLKTLASTGIIILKNSPPLPGTLHHFVETIFGFPRTTHYGHEFTVQSKPNASNLAYTSGTLNVHTDLPYYASPPGVQLLHCIKQIQGDAEGISTIVDGFSVGEFMKKELPEVYETLASVQVEFRDIGTDFIPFHKIHHSPTFVHDSNGNLTRIVYSNQLLSSCQSHLHSETVTNLYQGLKAFDTLCNSPSFMLKFKLEAGQILIFDNWRCLHGREGFNPQAGERHLEGAYVDWDEVESRIRVLLDQKN